MIPSEFIFIVLLNFRLFIIKKYILWCFLCAIIIKLYSSQVYFFRYDHVQKNTIQIFLRLWRINCECLCCS
ncbi:hypothetical protein HZS_744 [Henneguya salminicola]|nr:hypothetical protein HZS_744 [Henneguya salminicola]